jgi:hypothetical protein
MSVTPKTPRRTLLRLCAAITTSTSSAFPAWRGRGGDGAATLATCTVDRTLMLRATVLYPLRGNSRQTIPVMR